VESESSIPRTSKEEPQRARYLEMEVEVRVAVMFGWKKKELKKMKRLKKMKEVQEQQHYVNRERRVVATCPRLGNHSRDPCRF